MFINNFTDASIGVPLSCSIDNLIAYNFFKFLKILLISITFGLSVYNSFIAVSICFKFCSGFKVIVSCILSLK